jgi:hypothetical protein
MLITFNTKPTVMMKTTDKDKIQDKIGKLRMFNGSIRMNMQTAIDRAAELLQKYSKKTIYIICCSKPIMPFNPNVAGIDIKVLSPFSIPELSLLNQPQHSSNPIGAQSHMNLRSQSQNVASNVQGQKQPPSLSQPIPSTLQPTISNLPINPVNSSNPNVATNVQGMNNILLQNQMGMNQQGQLNMQNLSVQQLQALMAQNALQNLNTQSVSNQQPALLKMQQLNQQKLQQQMGNTNQFNLIQQQLNNHQPQFTSELQSNQFLESQQQQHQQHMARNNAITGISSASTNFGMMGMQGNMNMNNMNAMNLPFNQNTMMNQAHNSYSGSPSMVNQQRVSVWNGILAWAMNPQGMQPVEVQCAVTAIPAAAAGNNLQIDE